MLWNCEAWYNLSEVVILTLILMYSLRMLTTHDRKSSLASKDNSGLVNLDPRALLLTEGEKSSGEP